MSRHELIERFSIDRIGASAATFDYEKLDWMNGVHLRALEPAQYAHALLEWLRERGIEWPEETVQATVPLVQEKIERFDQYPDRVRFLFEPVSPDGADPAVCREAAAALEGVDRWEKARIEEALRGLADGLGLKPRQAFHPIRIAVTGSTVSPGLFESLELLGRDESLARLASAAAKEGGAS